MGVRRNVEVGLASVSAGPLTGRDVVLCHGVGDCAEGLSGLIDAFSPEFHTVAYDFRGHGHSPRFSAAQLADPFPVLVADLIAEVEQLYRPLVYGHSMGGAVVAEAAIARPELFGALVLEDPAWMDPDPAQARERGAQRVAALHRDLSDLPAALRRIQAEEKWPWNALMGWAGGRGRVQEEFVATGVVAPAKPWRQSAAELTATRIPTLLLTGTGDNCVLSPAEALSVAAVNMQVTVIEGARHGVWRTRPEETMRVVLGFVARNFS